MRASRFFSSLSFCFFSSASFSSFLRLSSSFLVLLYATTFPSITSRNPPVGFALVCAECVPLLWPSCPCELLSCPWLFVVRFIELAAIKDTNIAIIAMNSQPIPKNKASTAKSAAIHAGSFTLRVPLFFVRVVFGPCE